MKILWYSSTPECSSGYGNATRNMVRWLQRQDHFVAVATKHATTIAFRTWEGIPIIEGTNIGVVNRAVIDRWDMDVCISMYDVWGLKTPLHRHIAWIPIDTEIVNEKIIKVTKDLPMQIAMTEHGKAELAKHGLKAEYAPIGFDPGIFQPKPGRAKEFRASLVFPDHPIDPDDMFLIGSVGVNYPDDRKSFIRLMQAFKQFHDRYSEARLYLHTVANKKDNGQNYAGLAMQMGIGNLIAWPDQDRLFFEGYDETVLSEIYSGFDVFCLPTKGEGFGMPVVEAQACGVPVVASDNTSMPQLCKTGWLIKKHWDDAEYLGSNVWRYPPRASEIFNALEEAYHAGRPNIEQRCSISQAVSEFQWENVWEKYWTPIMAKIETLVSNGELGKGEENGIQDKV